MEYHLNDSEIRDDSRTFGRSSISKIIERSFKDLRDKDHSRIFRIKAHSRTFGRSSRTNIIRGSIDNGDQRPFKNLPKIFEIKDRSRIFEITKRSFKDRRKIFEMKVIQGSSRSNIHKGTSADLSYHRSFEDLWSVFEIECPPKIFGDLREQM